MCGLAGILSKDARDPLRNARIAEQMAQKLQHRGPDTHDNWSDQHIGLAHRRLTIRGVTARASQPIDSPSKRYKIVYNGEIYNTDELKDIIGKDEFAEENSDTVILSALLDRLTIKQAIEKCEGMFAIAIWDRKEQILTLARDRFGEKPLFYSVTPNSVIFCSEIKGLIHAGTDRTINNHALLSTVAQGYADGHETIYKNIRSVPPGTIITWNQKYFPTEKAVQYWSQFDYEKHDQQRKKNLSADKYRTEIQQIIDDSINKQLNSEFPICILLSGGIDSGLIAATASKLREIEALTIGFEHDQFDESERAKLLASKLNINHRVHVITENEVVNLVPKLINIYDEPFGDISQIPTTIAYKEISTTSKVTLTGDGADEIFAGYPKYRYGEAIYNSNLRKIASSGSIKRLIRKAAAIQFNSANKITADLPTHKIKQFLMLVSNDRQLDFAKSVGLLNRIPHKFVSKDIASTCTSEDKIYFSEYIAPNYIDAATLLDVMTYLPNNILKKVDRASMSNSVESRAPYLNHHLYERVRQRPELAGLYSEDTKMILRAMLNERVPGGWHQAPKMGFNAPMGDWLRNGLKEWAGDLLSSRPACDLLDHDEVSKLWSVHQHGKFDLSARLWPLISIASWAFQNAETRIEDSDL